MSSADSLDTVGIVGAGLVGSGWSIIFALAGLQVRVFDQDPDIRGNALDSAASALGSMAASGLATDIDEALARITLCDTLADAVSASDYIQEPSSSASLMDAKLRSRFVR